MDIEQYIWGMTPEGEAVVLYVMRAASGAEVRLCNYGATVVSVSVPDRTGRCDEVIAGCERYDDYAGDPAAGGKTLGRCAGRIGHGRMTIEGTEYRLERNDRGSHLHGGSRGFGERLWEGRVETNRVVMSLLSEEGDQGYPGQLAAEVVFDFDDDHALEITYLARTDRTTPVDLATRLHFDLAGGGAAGAPAQELRLAPARLVETDGRLLPTGRLLATEGSSCDFGSFRPLHDAFDSDRGIDERHFLLDGWQSGILAEAGELRDPQSGRHMTLLTSQPCITLRSGTTYPGAAAPDRERSAVLECGFGPDAVNRPGLLPSPLLHAGELYCQKTVFRFGIEA